LFSSLSNNLTSNTAVNSRYGFYLVNSSDNILFKNEAINSTIQAYYIDENSVGNELTGSIEANYLRVDVLDHYGDAIQNAEMKVETDGNIVYASPSFGGSNSTTDENGLTDWILVAFQTYLEGMWVENTTIVTVRYSLKIVNMSTSHTETFVVDNVPPSVTITTPSSDTEVNTGVIYINGTYNGTGSSVIDIECDDARFELQTGPPYGLTGSYFFVNSTPITTGEFWVQITVTDQSNLTDTILRHVIVDQDNPTIEIKAPTNDTVVNTGVIWINGTYNGTGSPVQSIIINDSRFDLVAGPPFYETGTYSFCNNTAILTGKFWVRLTVTDGASLTGDAKRHVIVDQSIPSLSITVPASGTTVNTGVIWINGTYNGTGSNVINIDINDTRFTLVEPSTHDVTGIYSFMALSIATGEFDITITIQDQAGYTETATRHLIVDQDNPTVLITFPPANSIINNVIWINGTFNGTGSNIMSIDINDTRFILIKPSDPSYGVTGDYSFRASNIGISEFGVEVTVQDEAGHTGAITRHVVVVSPPSPPITLLFYVLLLLFSIQGGVSPLVYAVVGIASGVGTTVAVLFYYYRFRRI